jgi:opacity protein-like surface antigen
MNLRSLIVAAAAAFGLPGVASAQTWYVGGSIGANMQADSDNAGRTGSFRTGNGAPAIPNQTAIAAGTPYGWSTEFDTGLAVSGEVGLIYGNGLRSGIEIAYSQADVDTHTGVNVGGTVIDGVDAAVLTGSATQLGATVGAVVANPGDDDVTNLGAFANLYYDFNREGSIQPYVGAGIGFTQYEVTYRPSGVNIIDSDDTVFAWQIKAGATWKLTDSWDLYGEYAYRQSEDVDLQNRLFPGSLSIENQQNMLSVGVRFRFGG